MTPETRYARAADGAHVAYQVHGDGPIDMFIQRGWFTNLDHEWYEPILAGVYRRLGSIGRVIRMDRRGSGLSDRFDPGVVPTLEDRVDDIRAVMDAVKSERVALIGLGHASALFVVFASTHPERTRGLVVWSPPRSIVQRPDDARAEQHIAETAARWGTLDFAREYVAAGAPSRIDDEQFVAWLAEDQRQSGTPAEAASLLRLTLETNIDEILPAVHVRTLVVWREGGGSEVATHVAGRIPGSVASPLPGDDMFLLGGDWRAGLREIETFLEGLQDVGPEADRVLATVMFTDLVGSTEMAARVGDSEWKALAERHHAAVRRELSRFRGREIDTAGDGFFAVFDGPARAIRGAAAIRAALAALGLEVKIGLHAGECERAGAGLRGIAVHVGARIGAAARAGEILVSRTVRDLVAGSGIEFEDAGQHSLKGVPEPWNLYRVVEA